MHFYKNAPNIKLRPTDFRVFGCSLNKKYIKTGNFCLHFIFVILWYFVHYATTAHEERSHSET